MTHYWWMHWFWITFWISLTNKVSPTTLYFSSTVQPLNVSNDSNRTAKAIGEITVPPTFESPSTVVKNISFSKTTSITKSTKPYLKKIDYLLQNTTTKAGQEDKDTVINPRNLTELLNVTGQLLINTSITGDIHTDNFTYLQEEASSIQNSERIGIEDIDDEGVNVPGGNLSAAGITGITLGCVVVVGVLCGVSYFMYHNRGFNRPQVLNDHCSNPDSSGYIDDASDNSEEMYSLDNDSFLNSLEAMTIQNYWTDTVKHTKL